MAIVYGLAPSVRVLDLRAITIVGMMGAAINQNYDGLAIRNITSDQQSENGSTMAVASNGKPAWTVQNSNYHESHAVIARL